MCPIRFQGTENMLWKILVEASWVLTYLSPGCCGQRAVFKEVAVLCIWPACCLSLFGLLEQNTTNWVAYKQHTFISHSSGGWEVQDQGTGRFRVWWGSISWFIACTFSKCPHMEEGARELSGTSFIKALISFIGAPPSWANYLLKVPSPNTFTLRVRISIYEFGGDIFSV